MPKLKSHRGVAKRFKKTGKGKIMRNRAFHSHLLRKKSQKRKRKLRKPTEVGKSDKHRIEKLLSYK